MNASGHVVRSRYLFLKSLGEEAMKTVANEVSPRVRAIVVNGPLETQWYPFDDLIELMVATDRLLGNGDLSLCRDMGRFGCETNLTGIYRIFFRFGSMPFILKRAAKAFRAQYDSGSMSVLESDPSMCRLRLSDFPRPHRAHCLAISGWMRRAGELTGEEEIALTETCRAKGDAECEWHFKFGS